MPKGELLLEIRCEEIPARMVARGIEQLATRLFEELMARQLGPREVETGYTPRRLMVVLKGLPEKEPDREEELQGPPASAAFDAAGKPTAAAKGFAKRCCLPVGALRRVETEKGEYVVAHRQISGKATAAVLGELVPLVASQISWAKTMRWGTAEGPWVRPVHGVLALFSGAVVEGELFGVRFSDTTVGHPVHSPKTFVVRGAADYRRKLSRRGIVIDFEKRREHLRAEMESRAAASGGRLAEDPQLLDKLTAICGVPGIVEGAFDRAFLELPREVLTASLRDHQSAFTVEGKKGLEARFLTVMDRSDDPQGRVRSGNEWVVAARLTDARFFFDEDRKHPLASRRGALDRLAFHERLGSYGDKADRVAKVGQVLCEALGWSDDVEPVARAAALAKLDLTCEMVKEFTSLQGVMGGVYAAAEGEPEAVWEAIYDQYLPASTADPIPRGRVGRVVALADRIDTLVGIFGLGQVPTGSKDPFGLRRAAQGVVRIALEAEMAVDLDLVAAKAFQFYGDRLAVRGKEVLAAWRPFLFDRVRHLLGLEGFAYDEIEAALAVGGVNLPDLKARVEALHEVRGEPGFLNVVLAAKRIANIVRDKAECGLHEQLFSEPAEAKLFRAYQGLKDEIERAEAEADYATCLRKVTGFAEVLDRFFVEVLVMDENRELRNNRIGLLQSIQRVLLRAAGLTEMVVDRAEHRDRPQPSED
jgi:glycyl-tRNA synthetase beta chain